MNTIGLNANDLDKHFILTNDIDMSQYTGEQYNVIVNFTGSFDGNNQTISNFSYSTSGNYAALFGRVYGDDAEIKNLLLINPNINAPSGFMVAAIIGDLSYGTIFGCYVQGGSVTGSEYVGGLIGEAFRAKILNCHSSASVTGDYDVGGLVGDMSGIVKYSSSSAAVICNDTNGYCTGGLLGNNGGVVIGSFSTGIVSNTGLFTGGLVGANFGTIAECYSHASATGGISTGGLIGSNSKTIVNCYSTGFSSSGGLVGSESENTLNIISNSFWDINTSGASSSEGGIGLTTSQMQDQTSLTNAGWDFVGSTDGPSDVWAIPDGGGYPVLWWQLDPVSALPIFSGGTGTEQDPCLIADADDLAMIGHNHRLMDLCFNLTRDIDMSGYDFESIGILGVPFTGVFDGDGFAISNLHISTDNDLSTGLFGYIYGDNTEIKNIGLVNPAINVNNSSHVGALIGYVHVEFGETAVVSSCYVEGGSVNGNDYVGGLIGLNGITYRGCTIIDCYSNTSVTAHDYAGGLAAQNSGSITACYSKGSVSGNNYIGGMVGIRNGLIAESYSTASVSGVSNVGGFSGNDSTFVSCFWDTETSGQATSPGAGILGLTTIEMQLQSTFENAGWDFVGASSGASDVWAIPDGGGYPILWWQLEPVPALPTFAGGSGTELDPYLIADAEDLSSIGHNHRLMNSSYKLVNDIDMSGENYYIIGDSVVPFAGSFDGDGKIIFNLTIDSNDIDCIGMFGKIYSKASIIEKIGMINPNIDANSGNSVGTLVGALGFGRVRQCYSKGGSVSGNTNVGLRRR
ncbi:MAG: GLUG motif-containing protein [Planctomycetota bacterium]|jgi:hypothetical protein